MCASRLNVNLFFLSPSLFPTDFTDKKLLIPALYRLPVNHPEVRRRLAAAIILFFFSPPPTPPHFFSLLILSQLIGIPAERIVELILQQMGPEAGFDEKEKRIYIIKNKLKKTNIKKSL